MSRRVGWVLMLAVWLVLGSAFVLGLVDAAVVAPIVTAGR